MTWSRNSPAGSATLRDVRQRDLPAAVQLLEVNRPPAVEHPDPGDVLIESDRGLRRTRGDVRGELLTPHVADGRAAGAGVLLAPGRDVGLRGPAGGRITDVGLAPAPRHHTDPTNGTQDEHSRQ